MKFTIGYREIQEEKLLSEGGYGYIWRAYDVRTQERFALKRMICQGQERINLAKQEMKILKMLPNSQNLVKFYGGDIITVQGNVTALYLLELCEGGSLFELMEKHMQTRFKESHLIQIMQQVLQGIQAMHTLNPPLAHRDIKIENILIQNRIMKLCDFGSCSQDVVDFSRIDQSKHYEYQEYFEKCTTQMYRPPEIVDMYAGYVVNEKVDIWMAGCVLYTLCFFVHPFLEGQTLAISSAQFHIPEKHVYSDKLIDFIRHMLTPNPSFRPTAAELLNITSNWDNINKIQLNQEAQKIKQKQQQSRNEQIQFESKVKPIKQFDGDIPMEELQKIQKEEDETTFIKKKAPPKKVSKKPVQNQQQIINQQIPNQQKPIQQARQPPQGQNIWNEFSQQSNNNQNQQPGWDNFNFDGWNNQLNQQQQSKPQQIQQSSGQSIWDMNSQQPQNHSIQNFGNNTWDQQNNQFNQFSQNSNQKQPSSTGKTIWDITENQQQSNQQSQNDMWGSNTNQIDSQWIQQSNQQQISFEDFGPNIDINNQRTQTNQKRNQFQNFNQPNQPQQPQKQQAQDSIDLIGLSDEQPVQNTKTQSLLELNDLKF